MSVSMLLSLQKEQSRNIVVTKSKIPSYEVAGLDDIELTSQGASPIIDAMIGSYPRVSGTEYHLSPLHLHFKSVPERLFLFAFPWE